MSFRRLAMTFVSIALGVGFIILLTRIGKIDIRMTLHQLGRVSRIDFIKLILLNSLLIYLSTAKWRSIDAVLRDASDSIPSRITSFAVSSVGMALGLVLPVQLGMTVARTIGTRSYGGAIKRGTAGTLFEQGFDLLIVVVLSIASGATWFFGGGGIMWPILACTMIALAMLALEPSIHLLDRLCSKYKPTASQSVVARGLIKGVGRRVTLRLAELQQSGLLNAGLGRRLIMLSASRFIVLVLMADQTAEAIDVHIPLWHMAAAMPFAALSSLIAVTPGGVGVNELTSATVLNLFGTPLTITSQWAVANRLLVVGSCFLTAAVAIMMQLLKRALASEVSGANKRSESEEI